MKKYLILPVLVTIICQAQTASKPNIIVVLADDLGYGDVSAYGSKTINTPNIDRLSKEGISFTNGYATSATSTPSRYALMTGMYPWRNDNAKILAGDAPLLISESQLTLPKIMKQVGYKTGAIGKWHLGMGIGKTDWNKKITPGANEIGFDYSYLIAATVDRVPTVYIENGMVAGLDPNDPIQVDYTKNFEEKPTALTNPELVRMLWSHGHNNSVINGIPRIGFMKGGKSAIWKDDEMAIYLADKVDTFLIENKNQPFFLYYGLHEPHVPRVPHSDFVGKSGMGPRGDAILEADWCIGKLLENLEKQNLLENTIIIFSSDNGPVLNDGYKDDAVEKLGNHKPSAALRGGKYSLFDAGTRVPFFVFWKGKIQPHKSDAVVCQMDLLPSIAKIVGVKVNQKIDGEDFSSTLFGIENKSRKKLIVEASGRLAMRNGNWILIPPYNGPIRNETGNELGNLKEYGLFDIKDDEGQLYNIASKNPKKLKQLKSVFNQITKGYYNQNIEQEKLR
ncbi:MAG: sulfatase-like hydrolase/transferase [Paludibacter sp.]|nr:sulfatase-like hydrolase/transferase [Paludibacter sp.]